MLTLIPNLRNRKSALVPATLALISLAGAYAARAADTHDGIDIVTDAKSGKLDHVTVDLVTLCAGQVHCEVDLSKAGVSGKLVIDGHTSKYSNDPLMHFSTDVDGLFGSTYEVAANNNKPLSLPANPTITSPIPIEMIYWRSSNPDYGPASNQGCFGTENDPTCWGAEKGAKNIVNAHGTKLIEFDPKMEFGKNGAAQIAILSLRLSQNLKNEEDIDFYETLRRAADVLHTQIIEARDIALAKERPDPKDPGILLKPWTSYLIKTQTSGPYSDFGLVQSLGDSLLQVERQLRGEGDGLSDVAVTDQGLRERIAFMLEDFDRVDPLLGKFGTHDDTYHEISDTCQNAKGKSEKDKAQREKACDADKSRRNLHEILADLERFYGVTEMGGSISSSAASNARMVLTEIKLFKAKLGMPQAAGSDRDAVTAALDEINERVDGPDGILDLASRGTDASPGLQPRIQDLAAYWNREDGGQLLIKTFDKTTTRELSAETHHLWSALNHLARIYPNVSFDYSLPGAVKKSLDAYRINAPAAAAEQPTDPAPDSSSPTETDKPKTDAPAAAPAAPPAASPAPAATTAAANPAPQGGQN